MIHLLSTVAAPVRVVGRGEFLDLTPKRVRVGESLLHYRPLIKDSNLFPAVDLPLLTPEFLQVFHSRFVASRKPLFFVWHSEQLTADPRGRWKRLNSGNGLRSCDVC